MLRILSSKLQRKFYLKYEHTEQDVLFEKDNKDGYMNGFTKNYIKVKATYNEDLIKQRSNVLLSKIDENFIMNASIKATATHNPKV